MLFVSYLGLNSKEQRSSDEINNHSTFFTTNQHDAAVGTITFNRIN